MKVKTTRKQIVATSPRLVSAGYCDLQNLLRPIDPVAYTAGVYGWNFDAYDVDGLTICTGYRNMPGRRANNIDAYEDRARAIWSDRSRSYEEQRADVLALLHEFAAQA